MSALRAEFFFDDAMTKPRTGISGYPRFISMVAERLPKLRRSSSVSPPSRSPSRATPPTSTATPKR